MEHQKPIAETDFTTLYKYPSGHGPFPFCTVLAVFRPWLRISRLNSSFNNANTPAGSFAAPGKVPGKHKSCPHPGSDLRKHTLPVTLRSEHYHKPITAASSLHAALCGRTLC